MNLSMNKCSSPITMDALIHNTQQRELTSKIINSVYTAVSMGTC